MRTHYFQPRIQVHRLVWLALLVATFLLLPRTASANAAPPMPRTWFTFVDAAAQPIRPDAVQILDCGANNADCNTSKVFAQFGTCIVAACITSAPSPNVQFDCADNLCLLMAFDGLPERFQLVVQCANDAMTSDMVVMVQQGYGARDHFRVAVADDGRATLTADPHVPDLAPRNDFALAFLLTLVSEIIVIGLLLRWLKQPLWPLLGLAGLMQVLSFPVVWVLFPSFLAWHLPSEKLVGAVLLVSALGLAGLLIWVRLASSRISRIVSIVLLVVAVPVSLVSLLGTLLVAGYGNNEFPQTSGLSYPIMLAAAELFAVVFEAVLLHFFSRRTLSLRQSAMISLAANVVSFALGLIIFPIAPLLI